jgi:hypothetical protein
VDFITIQRFYIYNLGHEHRIFLASKKLSTSTILSYSGRTVFT